MAETLEERSRRKFSVGVLDQAAALLGGLAGGVTIAGVVAPVVAAIISSAPIPQPILMLVVLAGILGGLTLACAGLYCKGLAKQMDDDGLV